MTKQINRGTPKTGIFGEEKRANKSQKETKNESNQNLGNFGKTKDVLPFPMFNDQDIPQKVMLVRKSRDLSFLIIFAKPQCYFS